MNHNLDEIKIQANTQNGSTASLINYSYPYNQEFETTPSTALGTFFILLRYKWF